jgi:polyisoprenoid-binding protein YceI
MKKTIIVSLSLLMFAGAFTLSNLWKVVKGKSVTINFKLNQEGTIGTFTGVDATIDFDEKNLVKSKITASIDVKTINTKNSKRDDHLRTVDYFDAEKYPKILFNSTSIENTNSGFLAKGKLTIKDQTQDIEVPFTFEKNKKGKASFKGNMLVSPFKYGIFKGEKRKEETVTVEVVIPLSK